MRRVVITYLSLALGCASATEQAKEPAKVVEGLRQASSPSQDVEHPSAAPTADNVAAPCNAKPGRFVFDPPGKRHSLPQLTWNGASYTVIGYDGPPTQLVMTNVDLAQRTTKSAALGAGGLAATATSGAHTGVVFIAMESFQPSSTIAADPAQPNRSDGPVYAPPERPQSYFMVVGRAGEPIVPRIPLGDRTVSHASLGVDIAWSPERKEWGVVWGDVRARLARFAPDGRTLGHIDLPLSGFLHRGKLLWTGSHYAIAVLKESGLALLELDDRSIVRETKVAPPQVVEHVVAYDGARFGVAYRIKEELRFALVKDGAIISQQTIARAAPGWPNDALGLSGAPRYINTPVLAVDGGRFVMVWGENRTGGWNDRLFFARLDDAGQVDPRYPVRLDREEIHQGYASIAGSGCHLAVSYILGDPNLDVRVAVVRPL